MSAAGRARAGTAVDPGAGRKLAQVRFPSMISAVSPRKATGKPPGRPRAPRRVVMAVYLDPRHAAELRRRAAARARERGTTRPDVSAVLRELLEEALKLKPPGK